MMTQTQETKALSRDPFSLFPSLLSMRNLRRALRKRLQAPLSLKDLAHLLSLDPLAIVRGLRLANSPLRNQGSPVKTVEDCLLTLGGPACTALFGGPAVDASGSQRIRILWMHSLATAHAARLLAGTAQGPTPEEAYAAGLLHDLPQLLNLLYICREGEAHPFQSSSYILPPWYRLPEEVTAWWKREEGPTTPLLELLQAAEHLAEVSGFRHPDTPSPEEDLLGTLYSKEPSLAQAVREEVRKALARVGLEVEQVLGPLPVLAPHPEDQISFHGEVPSYDLGKASNLLLEFTRAESLQTAVTVLLAAVRKYMGFDRAWFLRWSGPGGSIRFRVGQDLTPYPPGEDQVRPTPAEASWMGDLAERGKPAVLDRTAFPESTLLDMVGSDSAVLAPITASGAARAFLMADKGLQGRPVSSSSLDDLRAICGMAALLAENLLVQRVAWRHGTAANMDPLTGVYNRRAGLTRLARYMEKSRHTGKVVTLIMSDIDNFKKVNDTWGHQVGDQVLKTVARALLDRFDDIGVVSRIGGEEFLVILPERAPEEVIPYVEEVRQAVENASVEIDGGRKVKVTLSLGVTITHPTLDTPDRALLRADRALYASKQMGKNRFSVDPGDWEE